jgi:hypothetical protein
MSEMTKMPEIPLRLSVKEYLNEKKKTSPKIRYFYIFFVCYTKAQELVEKKSDNLFFSHRHSMTNITNAQKP